MDGVLGGGKTRLDVSLVCDFSESRVEVRWEVGGSLVILEMDKCETP